MKAWWLSILLLAAPSPACAAEAGEPLKRAIHEDWMVENGFAGFLDQHPDLWNYRAGAIAYNKGNHAKAMMHFRKAARFADKPSQAMISEMLWSGRGVKQDRAAAYAWADLAAERDYPDLAKLRDGIWAQLDEAERARALRVGKGLYAEYGDEVAQPRIVAALRRARNNVVGSRTGFTGNARIYALPPGGADLCGGQTEECVSNVARVDGSQFYAAAYWDPKHYFRWREMKWREQVGRGGYGEVGELEALPAKPKEAPARQD